MYDTFVFYSTIPQPGIPKNFFAFVLPYPPANKENYGGWENKFIVSLWNKVLFIRLLNVTAVNFEQYAHRNIHNFSVQQQ